MKDRIIQFLATNNLTSTKFADKIGVQRSSISHILSGRNKPSFDFIEKMLIAYPELDAHWLILGKGNMFKNQPALFNDGDDKKENLSSREFNIMNSDTDNNSISDSQRVLYSRNSKPGNIKKEEIERIIIFYTNGKFKEYSPNEENS